MNNSWGDRFQEFLVHHKLSEPVISSCVGPGWLTLLGELVRELRTAGWKGEFSQIKQKFGGLRISLESPAGRSPEFQKLVFDAESRSFLICEACGKPARLLKRPNGWLVTRCEACESDGSPMTVVHTWWMKGAPPGGSTFFGGRTFLEPTKEEGADAPKEDQPAPQAEPDAVLTCDQCGWPGKMVVYFDCSLVRCESCTPTMPGYAAERHEQGQD